MFFFVNRWVDCPTGVTWCVTLRGREAHFPATPRRPTAVQVTALTAPYRQPGITASYMSRYAFSQCLGNDLEEQSIGINRNQSPKWQKKRQRRAEALPKSGQKSTIAANSVESVAVPAAVAEWWTWSTRDLGQLEQHRDPISVQIEEGAKSAASPATDDEYWRWNLKRYETHKPKDTAWWEHRSAFVTDSSLLFFGQGLSTEWSTTTLASFCFCRWENNSWWLWPQQGKVLGTWELIFSTRCTSSNISCHHCHHII